MRVSHKGKRPQCALSLPVSAGPAAAPVLPPALNAVRTHRIPADHAGQRLDNFLLTLCKGMPKSHVYKLIRSGQVRVNSKRVQADCRLAQGDVLRLPPMRLATRVERFVPAASFPVVFEDDALLVVDKPAGLAVHGGSGVAFGVIEQLRSSRPGQMLELVHRLDRETSGLLMIAKQRRALTALHQIMREGRARKCYQALVVGDWVNDRQHLRQPLLKWLTVSNERRVCVAGPNDAAGKPAHTIVSRLHRLGAYTLVQAELRTGRTHQIRVHLAHQGFPIAGDDKYGRDDVRTELAALGFERMFLHAHRLELTHPLSGEALVFEAPLPEGCQVLLEKLLQKRGIVGHENHL